MFDKFKGIKNIQAVIKHMNECPECKERQQDIEKHYFEVKNKKAKE